MSWFKNTTYKYEAQWQSKSSLLNIIDLLNKEEHWSVKYRHIQIIIRTIFRKIILSFSTIRICNRIRFKCILQGSFFINWIYHKFSFSKHLPWIFYYRSMVFTYLTILNIKHLFHNLFFFPPVLSFYSITYFTVLYKYIIASSNTYDYILIL